MKIDINQNKFNFHILDSENCNSIEGILIEISKFLDMIFRQGLNHISC